MKLLLTVIETLKFAAKTHTVISIHYFKDIYILIFENIF